MSMDKVFSYGSIGWVAFVCYHEALAAECMSIVL